MTRRLYLVFFCVLLAVTAAAGVYLRQRAVKAARTVPAPPAQTASCDTPAPPPPPKTPPPKLPGFTLEAGCATAATAKPAAAKAKP